MLTEYQCQQVWPMIQGSARPLLNFANGNQLRSLPVQLSQESFDGTVWSLVSRRKMLAWDLQVNDPVCLVFFNTANQCQVCLYGIANFTADRELLRRFWCLPYSRQFPAGPGDRDCLLLEVFVENMEIWSDRDLPLTGADF